MRFTLSRTRIIQEEMEINARSKAEALRKAKEKTDSWWDFVSEETSETEVRKFE